MWGCSSSAGVVKSIVGKGKGKAGFLGRAQKGTGAEVDKPWGVSGRTEHHGPGGEGVVIQEPTLWREAAVG